MKVGLVLPQAPEDGDGGTWAEILALARRAEAGGADSLWLCDHFLSRFPDGHAIGYQEAWTLLSGLAAATARVELGTLVLATSFRPPVLLTKMAATADDVAGGRLILGLGCGWYEPEYHAFGYPFDHRVGRFEEALAIIHSLLRHGRVDFAGTYYEARDCELRPRGPRPSGPPILIGSTRERMLRLAARYADLWNAWLVWDRSHPDAIPPLRAPVDAACEEAGRDPATPTRTVAVRVDLRGSRARVQGSAEPLTGSPEHLIDAFRAFAGEGIAHLQVVLSPSTLSSVAAFAPVLERLA
jgi:alkanesulfonate monooxygenase SsuD/methylene tetrahydromethanopterin reductase-like flavin-dependent oxidoreductase (luciferase family)